MARCRCSGKALCLCLLPFVMMSHLLVYIVVSIFVAISYKPDPQLPVHFIAPGTSSNSSSASHPVSTFWDLQLVDSALWNRLQHLQDRLHNPILRGNDTVWVDSSDMAHHNAKVSGEAPQCKPDHLWASQLLDFNIMPEQMKDFVLSMHCRDYTLLMDQADLCARQDTDSETPMLLMAIKSQVGHFENRQAIRETWGKSGWVKEETGGRKWRVHTVFLLGRQDAMTGPHPDLAALLQMESKRHKDILQWDFRDTFFNLTLKDILFWDWLSMRCSHVDIIFKGDDDVFVRTRALLDFLNKQQAALQADKNSTEENMGFIVGDVIINAFPSRQPATKYYIPESFYKGPYPPYAGGGGVVYSGVLAKHLRVVSQWVNLFPIDDVYLGMCLNRLGISPIHHPGILTFDLPEADRQKPCAYRPVLLVHKRSPKQILTLWRQLKAPLLSC